MLRGGKLRLAGTILSGNFAGTNHTSTFLMKKLSALLTACTLSLAASAQVSLTGANPSYSQNFNTLDTGATNSSNLPTGWKIAEAGTSSSANGQYRSGIGTSNAGDTYSFGASQNTDRALGSLASNSLRSHFGASFINNTGTTITSVAIGYRAEQWRAGDTSSKTDTLMCYYSTTASDVDTSMTGWIEIPALLTLSTNSAASSSSGNALDGNTVFTSMNATLQLPTPLPDGATMRIKWVDVNILGSDDGIALDDLTMAFTTGTGGTGIANVAAGVVPVSILGRATTDRIAVGFSAAKAEEHTLSLYAINGREVARQTFRASAGNNQTILEPRGIAAGQYILRVSSASGVGTSKVTVE